MEMGMNFCIACKWSQEFIYHKRGTKQQRYKMTQPGDLIPSGMDNLSAGTMSKRKG